MTTPTTIEELRAELERVNRACAELRKALQKLAGQRSNWDWARITAQRALSTDAGCACFSREEVMPLVSAIDTIYKMAVDEKEVACEINTLWLRKHCAASLVHARTIGLLKEDAK